MFAATGKDHRVRIVHVRLSAHYRSIRDNKCIKRKREKKKKERKSKKKKNINNNDVLRKRDIIIS